MWEKLFVEFTNHLNRVIETQSHLLHGNFNLNDFMNFVVDQLQGLTSATGVVIELVDDKDMVYRAATGTLKEHIGLRLPIKNSISGLCVISKKILYSEDTEDDHRVNKEACRRVKARSIVVAPLFYQGNPVGVIKIISDQTSAF